MSVKKKSKTEAVIHSKEREIMIACKIPKSLHDAFNASRADKGQNSKTAINRALRAYVDSK